MSAMLAKLREERSKLSDTIEIGLLVQETRENYAISDEEQAEFDRLTAEAEDLDARIKPLEAQERRRADAARAAAHDVQVTREPLTYERGNGNNYFRDLAFAEMPGGHVDAHEARARLARHAAELDVELPRRAEKRRRAAEEGLERSFGSGASFEKRTNPNRTDGQGGYFVPPLWLIDEYIPGLRAGRPFVNSLRQMDLPAGTDSINIPKLSTLTLTGVQTADAAAVTSQDFTDTVVNAPVRTIAGQEDVAMQLIEQSPGQIIDQVVIEDLVADYNKRCDVQSLQGTGLSGQVLGIRNLSSPNTVAYTDSSPTVPEFWPAPAQALSKIATTRFDVTNVRFFMHPRRWFWLMGSLDSSNRPLVVPAGWGALSPVAQSELAAQGHVGALAVGAPVSIDANITTAAVGGAVSGGTEDEIYAVKCDDTFWFEGDLRTRVLFEILSGTLQVRFQVYNYVAQLTRYDQGVALVQGTGLAAPSGY